MQYINHFKVLPHKSEALSDWLKKKDKLLHYGNSEGWHYLGAGFGREALQQIFNAFAPNEGETALIGFCNLGYGDATGAAGIDAGDVAVRIGLLLKESVNNDGIC